MKRFITRSIYHLRKSISQIFINSSELEKEFRLKLQSLLPEDSKVVKASKYTESEEYFTEKLPEHPPDYFIEKENKRIAVIEVTSGKRGYTVRKSNFLKISENKLEPLQRENIAGYVVVVVIAEDKSSLERYIWCPLETILKSPKKWERVGVGWTKEMNVYYVDIDKWTIGIKRFVDKLLKIAESSKQTTLG